MSHILDKNTKLTEQVTSRPISGFIKALAFYTVLYVFWIVLFIANDGPGGVEFQHIVMMGISYAVLILIHGLSAFKPEDS